MVSKTVTGLMIAIVLLLLGGLIALIVIFTKKTKSGPGPSPPSPSSPPSPPSDPCNDKLPKGKWSTYPKDPTLCYTKGDLNTWPEDCCTKSGFNCDNGIYSDGQPRCAMSACINQNNGSVPSAYTDNTFGGWKQDWVCDMNTKK